MSIGQQGTSGRQATSPRREAAAPGPPAPPSRRVLATRRALMDGAVQVFGERGFERATVAEVVERSGASVGSLYNLFGGKAELFLALYDDYASQSWEATNRAMDDARAEGITDPLEVYRAGARAYLLSAWRTRRLARLFVAGDGPPGFPATQRENGLRWLRRIVEVLEADRSRYGETFTAAVNAVVGAGARQIVATCETEDDARELTEYVVALVMRLASTDIAPERSPAPCRETIGADGG